MPVSDGRARPTPTAHGARTAIVVCSDGGDAPAGAGELYCDALGRVCIRYHWQECSGATCWVRVAQRFPAAVSAASFLPRIGKEVVMPFVGNGIDRPTIVGAGYDGRSEGTSCREASCSPSSEGALQFQPALDHRGTD